MNLTRARAAPLSFWIIISGEASERDAGTEEAQTHFRHLFLDCSKQGESVWKNKTDLIGESPNFNLHFEVKSKRTD